MRIYILVGNSGDGSSHLRFLDSLEAVNFLTENDEETYSDGDGGSYSSLEAESISYPHIETLAEVKAEWEEEYGEEDR